MPWFEISKYYKGGGSKFQVLVPPRFSKSDWQTLLEWLGDNTNGGHNYGYSIRSRKLRRKSTKLKVVAYDAGLTTSTMAFAKTHGSTRTHKTTVIGK